MDASATCLINTHQCLRGICVPSLLPATIPSYTVHHSYCSRSTVRRLSIMQVPSYETTDCLTVSPLCMMSSLYLFPHVPSLHHAATSMMLSLHHWMMSSLQYNNALPLLTPYPLLQYHSLHPHYIIITSSPVIQ